MLLPLRPLAQHFGLWETWETSTRVWDVSGGTGRELKNTPFLPRDHCSVHNKNGGTPGIYFVFQGSRICSYSWMLEINWGLAQVKSFNENNNHNGSIDNMVQFLHGISGYNYSVGLVPYWACCSYPGQPQAREPHAGPWSQTSQNENPALWVR